MMLIFTNLMVISFESINGDHVGSGPVAYCGDGHGWLDGMGCQNKQRKPSTDVVLPSAKDFVLRILEMDMGYVGTMQLTYWCLAGNDRMMHNH